MIILAGLLSVAAFVVAFIVTGLVPVARKAANVATTAVAQMRDPALDDLAREKAVQQASINLFKSLGQIVWRFAAILLAAYVPILLFHAIGLADKDAVLNWLLRLDVIIGISVVMTAIWFLASRLWPRT